MVENLNQFKKKRKIDGGDKRYELTQERELEVNSGAGIHSQRKESMADNANYNSQVEQMLTAHQ